MSASSDHHIKGPGGCQFSQWFWSFNVKILKSIAGLRVKKKEYPCENYLYRYNFFGRIGSLIQEILAEQVAFSI